MRACVRACVRAGFLLLMRVDSRGELSDEEHGLVLAVGGDTMRCISLLTQRSAGERPLALDLLWQVGLGSRGGFCEGFGGAWCLQAVFVCAGGPRRRGALLVVTAPGPLHSFCSRV